ncbi:uncharacterized protein LOC123507167 [Portunus trituberculatus]|uniref:uncharacterized protein LOC123507167 n=1 Tax=Portunus trituberculatus TaxID=210409 RepID=UPI001E1CDE00|nr:uncharacterized protein LOC123507167 [Portunus trituberculatus]
MTVRLISPGCTALFLLLTVAGGGLCQELLQPQSRECNAQVSSGLRSAMYYPAEIMQVNVSLSGGDFNSLEVYQCLKSEAWDECAKRDRLDILDGDTIRNFQRLKARAQNYTHAALVILPDATTCHPCTLQVRILSTKYEGNVIRDSKEKTFCLDITRRAARNLRLG